MNNLLSICIPTYNRAKYLDLNLSNLIDLCQEFDVPIYISDNHSTDNTKEIVEKYKSKYAFIDYRRLPRNFGIDYNINNSILMASTDYCWILGDDDQIDNSAIKKLLEIIVHNQPDFLLLNAREILLNSGEILRESYFNTVLDNNMISENELVKNYSGMMTLLSACVVRRELWKKVHLENYSAKYYFHIYNVFHSLGSNPKIYILGDPIFTRFAGNKWQFKESEIDFVLHYYYPKTIELLPNTLSFKLKMLAINHKLGRMKIGTFLRLREERIITIYSFPKSYFYLMRLHLPLALFALFLSPKICGMIYKLGEKILRR